MEKYVWAVVVLLISVLAMITALVITNHSDDVKTIGIMVAQSAGFLLNFYMTYKTTKRLGQNVATKVDEVKDVISNGNNSG